jgi:iron(III) transport system permease protein
VGITLPLILPAILGASLLVFVLALGQFGIPAVLGMPHGYMVATTRIYQLVAGFNPNYAAAAAMGLSLMLFSVIGVWLQIRILGGHSFTTITGRAFRPRPVDVGKWKIPLLAFAMLYLAVAIVLPIGAVIWASALRWLTTEWESARFTWANYEYILFEYPVTQIAIKNSLLLSVAGSVLVIGLSVLVSWYIERTRLPGRRSIELISMVPLAVPSIVFSLGLLWAWIRLPLLDIYGTLWILLICYITIFLPYGMRSITASFKQIDKSLEECANVCGAGWSTVLRSVTLPLLAPGIWAGWTLVFVSILKELSASALLYTSKTVVLSVAVFDLLQGSSFPRVAALSLLQALLIFAVLFSARIASGRKVTAF